MSRGTSDRRRSRWGFGPVLTVAIIGALAVMAFAYGYRGAPTTGAQASPAASPATATCTPPATAMASPAAASPAASPAAELNGTPAASDMVSAANGAVANYVACWNAQNIDALVALSTPNYFGTYANNADAAKAALAPLTTLKPMFTINSVANVQTYNDGRISAEVTGMLGQYQFVAERWYFTQSDGQWLLDQVDTLPTGPEGDTSIVGVVIDPTSKTPLAPNSTESAPFPVLDFHFQSSDKVGHAIWVVQLPAGAEGTPVAGGALPDGTTFIGLTTIPGTPNPADLSNGDIWLTNLGPGTYALTDLTNPAMFATFTVTAPPAATPGAATPAA